MTSGTKVAEKVHILMFYNTETKVHLETTSQLNKSHISNSRQTKQIQLTC